MNIATVARNIKNTISGKEMLLDTYQNPSVNPYPKFVKETMIQMVEINIAELKRILQDVEQCVKKESDDSWITNPDRMGGAWTTEELDPNRGWK
jgi:hypothetical protein